MSNLFSRLVNCHPSLSLFQKNSQIDVLFLFLQRAQFQIHDAIARCQSPPPRRQAPYSWKPKSNKIHGYGTGAKFLISIWCLSIWHVLHWHHSHSILYLLYPLTDLLFRNFLLWYCGMPGVILVYATTSPVRLWASYNTIGCLSHYSWL